MVAISNEGHVVEVNETTADGIYCFVSIFCLHSPVFYSNETLQQLTSFQAPWLVFFGKGVPAGFNETCSKLDKVICVHALVQSDLGILAQATENSYRMINLDYHWQLINIYKVSPSFTAIQAQKMTLDLPSFLSRPPKIVCFEDKVPAKELAFELKSPAEYHAVKAGNRESLVLFYSSETLHSCLPCVLKEWRIAGNQMKDTRLFHMDISKHQSFAISEKLYVGETRLLPGNNRSHVAFPTIPKDL